MLIRRARPRERATSNDTQKGWVGGRSFSIPPIRVCTCSDVYSAELSKRHNNSNILTMGARVVGVELAKMIARHWLTAEFEGGRHQRRIDMIAAIEEGRFTPDAP